MLDWKLTTAHLHRPNISIGSLAFTKTVPRAVREKTALLMQFYTDYLQYFNVETVHTVAYSTDDMTAFTLYSAFTFAFMNQLLAFL